VGNKKSNTCLLFGSVWFDFDFDMMLLSLALPIYLHHFSRGQKGLHVGRQLHYWGRNVQHIHDNHHYNIKIDIKTPPMLGQWATIRA
jgi:hypothetical protein